MYRTTMILIVLALFALASVPAMAVDWEQIGSTDTAGYLASATRVPLDSSSGANFSAVGAMPTELAVVGGVVPDFKVTYDLLVAYDSGLGTWSMYGNNGLALFVGATPSGTRGLFTGVNGDFNGNDFFYTGAITGNSWTTPGGTGNYGGFTGPFYAGYVPYPAGGQYYGGIDVFNVSVEKVGATATTTITGADSKVYSVTTADATNWTGGGNFAAFHCYSPTFGYGQSAVTNITFYQAAPVPEPGSLMMLGMGAAGLAGLLKRRSR